METSKPPITLGFVTKIALVALVIYLGVRYTESIQNRDEAARGSTASSAPKVAVPFEKLLARIDGSEFDALKVARFRSLLDQLEVSYTQSETQIGDQTEYARERLREKGVATTLLEIMEDMNSIQLPAGRQSYDRYLAGYIVLRNKGFARPDAVDGLKLLHLVNAPG